MQYSNETREESRSSGNDAVFSAAGQAAPQAPTMSPEEKLKALGFKDVDSDSVRRFVRGDITIRVEYHEDPQSPRDDDGNAGIMAIYPRSGYSFGDETLSDVPENAIVSADIYAYVHGGITIAFSPDGFPDQLWDVSRIGFMYTTTEHLEEQVGRKMTREQIMRDFQLELDDMNKYLSGQVCGFDVEQAAKCSMGETHTKSLLRLGGYYDIDDALAEAISCVPEESNGGTVEAQA